MIVVCNSQLLAAELRLLAPIAPSKATLPILMNVLIRAEDKLYLTATDMEVGMVTTCPAVITEHGSITIPIAKLLALVEQFTNGDVTITADNKTAHVTFGSFKSRLQTITADDYPTMPEIEGIVSTLEGRTLRALIDKTRYAITEGNKYAVPGAQFTLQNSVAAMATTDGKRISVTTQPWDATGIGYSAIIPQKTLDVLLAQPLIGTIECSQSDRHLFFVSGQRMLFSRMLEAKFPSYARMIPKDHEHIVSIEVSVFKAMLKRVGVMTDKSSAVYLTTGHQTLTGSVNNAEIGAAEDEMAVHYDGPDIKVCVNSAFVLDFLDAASNPVIKLALKDKDSPLLFTDGDDFLNVVLGIRV